MRYAAVPRIPVDLDEALRLYPVIHQSLLADYDDCPLSTLFAIRYGQGWTTAPAARGQIFHRFCAEALRDMQRSDSESIPVGVALAILEETLRQKDVPPEEIVRVPLREIPVLRMVVAKWAKDNAFSVRRIVDVERRLTSTLSYEGPDGTKIERALTGQLDLLLVHRERPDEAIVVDWKDTWALPPRRHEDAEDPGISYRGYFQQRFYGWLVMKTYPSIEAVTLREFYARRTEARPARITRADLDAVERDLSVLVEAFDKSVMAGAPPRLDAKSIEKNGHWKPQPGAHCFNCDAMHRCPLGDEAALPTSVRTPAAAERWAAARQVAVAVKKRADLLLWPWAELHGPIPLRSAKGRRVLGVRAIAEGKKTRFEEYTPTGQDRPATRDPATDRPLEDAMREAVATARAARG